MDPSFNESRMVLPKNLALLLTAVLIATVAAMACTKLWYYKEMNEWSIYACAIIFAIAIVLCFLMRYSVTVYEDRIEVFYIVKKTVIPMEDIIDTKVGEITVIKNYANWNLKGVKYKTYSAIGDEYGVGLKLTGMRVFYLSSKDHEALYALLPKEEA